MRILRAMAIFIAANTASATFPAQAQYYGEPVRASSTMALAGGAAGAMIAGPYGAAAGAIVGAAVGVPRFTRRNQECWYDRAGMRHCRFY